MEPIISRLELRGLRAVVAVADHGSFRAAAASLGYTQSSISHQVAEVERALGTALFTRPGGRARIALTAAGEAAYRHARRTLAEVHALDAGVRAVTSRERVVIRVGVFQTAAAELLPAALSRLREDWPGIEVELTDTGEDPQVVAWLAEGRLDLALTLNQSSDDRIELVRLFEDPWVILTPHDSSLAREQDASFDRLDGEDVVAWTSRWAAQNELEAAWRRRGISPRVVYRTDDNLALQRLVAAHLGHACIGRLAARRAVEPTLTYLQPPDELSPRTVALCHPRRRQLSEAAIALVGTLRAQFAPESADA